MRPYPKLFRFIVKAKVLESACAARLAAEKRAHPDPPAAL